MINRRHLLTGSGAAVLFPHAAHAQAWPSRNITLVVPFPPGGTNDIFARAIADRLGAALGVPVIIDNRGGAAGTIGSTAVARAAPDGYTLMTGHIGTLGVNPSLYPNLPYDTLTGFDYVTALGLVPNLLVVHPSLPFKTVQDLIDYARANPDKLNYATAGTGSAADIAMAAFNLQAKTRMVPVPYRGTAPAVTDLLAGQLQLTITGATAVLQHVQAGTLRALGVTTLTRIRVAPEIPAIAETLPGYEASQWYGIVTPAHTPAPILNRLAQEIHRIMHSPDVLARLEAEGVEPWDITPEEFRAYVAKEIPRWKAIVAAAKINAQ
jgi:tripartite-type tricarboxylate transporter receptor subunit TctC